MRDTEAKLLSRDYLKAKIEEMPAVRRGEVGYLIEESDRLLSKTIYVSFTVTEPNGRFFKGKTLRISDHEIETIHEQLIINPNKPLTTHKKEQLKRLLDGAYKGTMTKRTIRKLYGRD